MSDTPRTDAIALRSMDRIAYAEMIGDLAALARELEQELSVVRSAMHTENRRRQEAETWTCPRCGRTQHE